MQSSIICNDEKIINTLKEVLKRHGIQTDLYLNPRVVIRILARYTSVSNGVKKHELSVGELDTFKIASILMIAIYNSFDTFKDEVEKAQIALDVAYAFIEKPYFNGGPNYDEPYALEQVDFSECFKNDIEYFEESNNRLLKSLILEKAEPHNYYNNLELLYKLALLLKHENDIKEIPTEEIPIKNTKKSLTKSLKDLFARIGA